MHGQLDSRSSRIYQRRVEVIEALLKIFLLCPQIFWLLVHYRGLYGHVVIVLSICSGTISQHVLSSSACDL